jgi:FKBP-type peptidyl-prolyl cis-trans isomerase FklB
MKKLYGWLCALTLAAFVPMCAAADAPPATEMAAPAVTAPAEATTAPAATAPAAPETPAPAAPKSDKEKMSYALGTQLGTFVKNVNLDVDMESLSQGIRDAAAGRKLALSEAEIQSALEQMKAEVQQKQQEHMKEVAARMKELGEKNKVDGPKFLEENKKKEGVVTLPSGLQYKVLKEGEGKLPGPTDIVTVSYRGLFIDGAEFDSSAKHGRPLDVPLDGGFIAGMTDALKMMKAGSKWMIYIPSDLAYKEDGRPPVIAPNSVLIFEVEVLGIKEKPKEAAEPPPTK